MFCTAAWGNEASVACRSDGTTNGAVSSVAQERSCSKNASGGEGGSDWQSSPSGASPVSDPIRHGSRAGGWRWTSVEMEVLRRARRYPPPR